MNHLISLIGDSITSDPRVSSAETQRYLIEESAAILSLYPYLLNRLSIEELSTKLVSGYPIISESNEFICESFLNQLWQLLRQKDESAADEKNDENAEDDEDAQDDEGAQNEDEDASSGGMIALKQLYEQCQQVAQKNYLTLQQGAAVLPTLEKTYSINEATLRNIISRCKRWQLAPAGLRKEMTQVAKYANYDDAMANLPPALKILTNYINTAEEACRDYKTVKSVRSLDDPAITQAVARGPQQSRAMASTLLKMAYAFRKANESAKLYVDVYNEFIAGLAAEPTQQPSPAPAPPPATGRKDVSEVLFDYPFSFLDDDIRRHGVQYVIEKLQEYTPLANRFAMALNMARRGKSPAQRDFFNNKLFNKRIPIEQRQHYYHDFLFRLTQDAAKNVGKETAYRGDLMKHANNLWQLAQPAVMTSKNIESYFNAPYMKPDTKKEVVQRVTEILSNAIGSVFPKIRGDAIVYKDANPEL